MESGSKIYPGAIDKASELDPMWGEKLKGFHNKDDDFLSSYEGDWEVDPVKFLEEWMVDNALNLSEEQRGSVMRLFLHGGSRNLSGAETKHVQDLFKDIVGMLRSDDDLAQAYLQLVNGAGGGAMQGSAEGARMGRTGFVKTAAGVWVPSHLEGGANFGVTSLDIIHSEIPHSHQDRVFIAPSRNVRMLFMLLFSFAGAIVDGGVGTFEELLASMEFLLDEENLNNNWEQRFLLSSPTRDGVALKFYDFLEMAFNDGNEARNFTDVFKRSVKQHVGNDDAALRGFLSDVPLAHRDTTFNGKLHVPASFAETFVGGEAAMAELEEKGAIDDSPLAAIGDVRRIIQYVIWATVTNRKDFDAINGRPAVPVASRFHGSLEKLLKQFFEENRIKETLEGQPAELENILELKKAT
jgi:hypothetical protein